MITAEELLEKYRFKAAYHIGNSDYDLMIAYAIEFAKMHVEAALKEASVKALLLHESNWGTYEDKLDNPNYQELPVIKNNKYGHGDCTYEIIKPSKQSILNAYPLENIK